MAVRVSQRKDDFVMTDNVKLISMILLSVSLFFCILFFTAFQLNISGGNLGASGDDYLVFVFLVSMTALTVSVISMEFYHIRHRALAMFKYGVIVANAVVVGLVIHQLTKGYDDLFGNGGDPQDATMFTYASLATGFAGIGTLLAVLHNFHGIMGLV